MNATLLKALVLLAVAGALFGYAVFRYSRTKTRASLLQLIGTGLWIVVALAHVCEGMDVFPWMGWGKEHSVGHYLDLGSAVLGACMLAIGFLVHAVTGRRR